MIIYIKHREDIYTNGTTQRLDANTDGIYAQMDMNTSDIYMGDMYRERSYKSKVLHTEETYTNSEDIYIEKTYK